ncbi:MAG TPA: hypothetical protein VLB46_16415 [Pyrinomonadaceae bacterium]|nr:hypothetical protein [Pyrinomonadaceae bacterium]
MGTEFSRIDNLKFVMIRVTSIALLILLTTPAFPGQAGARNVIALSLASPFDTEPFDTEATGNSAANLSGSFRQDGGPEQFRYFIGTNITAGSLIMDFAVPFTDGPGNDFAILTNAESWGPLADQALFEFFLDGTLQASFIASLAPNQLFEFDLPGTGVVADRVVVTNITPDPPEIDNSTTMTFDDAGVAHLVGESVIIDIKPGNDSNLINPKSKGMISVAILSTSTFDATIIDPLSVKFGPNQTTAQGRSHIQDVNHDGSSDLVLRFNLEDTGIQCGDLFAFLTGETIGGQPIAGFDLIQTVACK